MQEEDFDPLSSTASPSVEAIHAEVRRILASKPFATATRSRRFLSYVTERTLAGDQDAIKELILGTEVFDRANDFDPRIDTIVRVEAGKLRKRLEEYYSGEGIGSTVRIDIPKGGYVPRFEEVKLKTPPEGAAPKANQLRKQWIWLVLAILSIAVIAAVTFYFRTTSPVQDPSVAVLPFLNFSPDTANEYLADGLTEDLTDALVRLGGMRVASRTSAFYFKGKQPDIRDVSAKLHVAYLLEGSVRKDGQRIKVTVQLIRAVDGFHVWSNSFERNMNDVFSVQREIAEAVASRVEQTMTGAKLKRLVHSHTASVEAFDLYMRGRHAAAGGFITAIGEAERFHKEAIAADQAYPLPLVALAELYLRADILGLRPSQELYTKAKEAINKALTLDNEIAEAHAILGSLSARHEYDWVAAEKHLRAALELDPNSAFAHNTLAQDVLVPQGRWQEAMIESRKALELDPFSPVVAMGQPWLQHLQRNYDPALEGFRRLASAAGSDPGLQFSIAGTLLAKGDFEGALKIFESPIANPPPLLLALTASAQTKAGHPELARKILRDLLAGSKTRFVGSGPFVVIHTALNERDQAFAYLERAREGHESFLIFSRVDPLFDPLRADPRFAVFLGAIGLSDQAIAKNQSLTRSGNR